MKGYKKRSISSRITIIMVFSTLSLLLGSLVSPLGGIRSAYGYNDGAHTWIIEKAVEYLKQRKSPVVSDFPLDIYLPWIISGAQYADHPEKLDGIGWRCIWEYDLVFTDGIERHMCDTIHHYGYIREIETEYGIDSAHPGEFAAPDYAEVLFEQAVKFWPGGRIPKLSELPQKDAGRTQTPTGSTDLGITWPGGLPFCDLWSTTVWDIPSDLACPKWPTWASDPEWPDTDDTIPFVDRYKIPQESARSAMIYLGWAIHMIEDLTVPHHATNRATEEHASYEDFIDKGLEEKSFEHLPFAKNEHYLLGEFYPIVPDYFDKVDLWLIKQFALESRRIGLEMYDRINHRTYDGIILHAQSSLDGAIKLVAAILEKYFLSLRLEEPDEFEDNNSFFQAKEIYPGLNRELTIHVPNDEDWYKIHVAQDYSDVVIDIVYYDPSLRTLAATVYGENPGVAGTPQRTDYGMRIVMNDKPVGDYWIHVYPNDLQTTQPYLMTTQYDMIVSVGVNSLPPDFAEENDTPETARTEYAGITPRDRLNIDKVGDDDYYSILVDSTASIEVTIDFDPTQGELQLYLDGINATEQFLDDPNNKRVSTGKRNGSGSQSIVRVTGDINWYGMAVSITYPPPPGPTPMDFAFQSNVALDNVNVLVFSNDAGEGDGFIRGNLFLPPDTDQDDGGNVPPGSTEQQLAAKWSFGTGNFFVVVGTTGDENNFVISSSRMPSMGTNFDTQFPEFVNFGGSEDLLTDLSDGTLSETFINPCRPIWEILHLIDVSCQSVVELVGEPDGQLLTPHGGTATLYTFPGGEAIGTVGSLPLSPDPEDGNESSTTSITSSGGTASLPDGSVSAYFSEEFFDPTRIPDEIFVSIVMVDDGVVPPANTGFQLLGHVYDFTIVDAQGNSITDFGEGNFVELTFQFDPDELNGMVPVIQTYDGENWLTVQPPSQIINDENDTVTAFTDHFTLFGVFGIPEPGTLVLLGTGLIAMFAYARKNLKKKGK